MGLERFLRFFNHLLWIKQRSSFPLEVIALFFFFISDYSYGLYFSSGLMYAPNLDYAEAAFWSLCFWQLAWVSVSTLSAGSPRIRALLLLQPCLAANHPLLGLCWLWSHEPCRQGKMHKPFKHSKICTFILDYLLIGRHTPNCLGVALGSRL